MKRMVIIVLCMCMTISVFASNVSAAIISDHPLTEEELREASQIPAPMIYTTCTGGNGICQMHAQGWAYVYDENGNYLSTLTCAWQCENCHTVMVTSGDPKIGQIIGDYVIVPCGYDLGLSVIQYVYVNASDVQRCESNHLDGYVFHN